MNFEELVEGGFLWIVFIVFSAAVLLRLFSFVFRITSSGGRDKKGPAYYVSAFGRVFLPLHMLFFRRPGYASLRYLFHVCLFVVPIWLSGHIALWSESRLGWDWAALPDSWADWMTLLVIAIALVFLIRRVASPHQRKQTSAADYWIIIITALPFVSGYFLTHGTLDSIGFFSENMRVIHVLSGEAMVLMAAFLFCRTRMDTETCTACASCEIACPTGTLQSKDSDSWRVFTYSHYQCLCCGSCVGTCPENAAQLRHEVSPAKLFQILPNLEIRRAELKPCRRCGALFVPEPLFAKIGKSREDEYLHFCPVCRKVNIGEIYLKLSPWHKRDDKIKNTTTPPIVRDALV